MGALDGRADVGAGDSFSSLADAVASVEAELALELLTGEQAQDAAVAAMCRRLLSGVVSPRELTYWVTRIVGWRGSIRTRPLLTLEDDYCDVPLTTAQELDLDDRVRTAAEAFLAGPATEPVSGGGLRAVLRRWRAGSG